MIKDLCKESLIHGVQAGAKAMADTILKNKDMPFSQAIFEANLLKALIQLNLGIDEKDIVGMFH